MRCLDRDRKSVWIGRYVGKVPVQIDGKFTGKNEVVYEDPYEFFPTLSSARGEGENDYFGQKLDYDRTVTIDDSSFQVNEADVLWIDKTPGDSESEAYPNPHDYIVKRVARTSAYTVIAAKRVDVSR